MAADAAARAAAGGEVVTTAPGWWLIDEPLTVKKQTGPSTFTSEDVRRRRAELLTNVRVIVSIEPRLLTIGGGYPEYRAFTYDPKEVLDWINHGTLPKESPATPGS